VLSLLLIVGLSEPGHATQPNPLSASDGVRSASSVSGGGIVGYADHAAWVAAAGPTTLVTFESFPNGTQITTQLDCVKLVSGFSPNPFPPGPVNVFVTASTSLPFPMFVAGNLPSEPNFLSNDLSPQGGSATGATTFDMSWPTTAIGAYVADSAPLDGFRIEVFLSNVNLGSITVPARTLPNSFVGLVSSSPFDKAVFSSLSTTDSWGLDNLEYNCNVPTPTNPSTWGRVKQRYR
jgi:hypothetical protein